jgi:hypothetical protein
MVNPISPYRANILINPPQGYDSEEGHFYDKAFCMPPPKVEIATDAGTVPTSSSF